MECLHVDTVKPSDVCPGVMLSISHLNECCMLLHVHSIRQ